MKLLYCKACRDAVAMSPCRCGASSDDGRLLRLERYDGDRAAILPLLRLADDSETELESYLHAGVAFVAREADTLVGVLLLTETAEPHVREIKNMAIVETMRGGGLGRALIHEAITHCQERPAQPGAAAPHEVRTLLVATATAGLGQLRFYQRVGFRMLRIERDAFGPHNGYPADLALDGIPLRDRVWLSIDLPIDLPIERPIEQPIERPPAPAAT